MQAQRRQPLTWARASTETVHSTKTHDGDEDDEDVEMRIEGLTDDYCDDFVCTSSPAVEQTLRSLAKDLVRRRWTPVLFARDVKYRVGAVTNTIMCHSCSALVAQICTRSRDVTGAQGATEQQRCLIALRCIALHFRSMMSVPQLQVLLQDTYRRFSGAERHKRLMHISENVRDAKVVRPSMAGYQ